MIIDLELLLPCLECILFKSLCSECICFERTFLICRLKFVLRHESGDKKNQTPASWGMYFLHKEFNLNQFEHTKCPGITREDKNIIKIAKMCMIAACNVRPAAAPTTSDPLRQHISFLLFFFFSFRSAELQLSPPPLSSHTAEMGHVTQEDLTLSSLVLVLS